MEFKVVQNKVSYCECDECNVEYENGTDTQNKGKSEVEYDNAESNIYETAGLDRESDKRKLTCELLRKLNEY